MRVLVIAALAGACTEPVRLAAGTCGNGVVDPGEDCDGASGGDAVTCGAPDTPHACHFTCMPMMGVASQCPAGDVCGMGGACIAASDVCGNGLVDGSEECDPTVATASGTCGQAGTANACRFVCGATVACPTGATCGRDGVCRQPSGTFQATTKVENFPSGTFTLTDVDGDGLPDLVGTSPLTVHYGAGNGTFPRPVELPGTFVAAIGDVTGDGRPDFALDDGGLTEVAVSHADGSLTLAPFPTFAVTGPGTRDLWLPIRLDASQPLDELLHVAIGGGTAHFGFDELHVDPDPVTLPAPDTVSDLAGTPPPFAIADAIDAPGVGGDEIAIGLRGTPTIHVFTAAPGFELVHDQDIPLPGTLLEPPLFADVDGDGKLDLIAAFDPGDGSIRVVDALNNGSGFAAPVPDNALTPPGCIPIAAANVVGDARAEIFCPVTSGIAAGLVTRGPSNTLTHIADPPGVEAVFPDINHDGIPDVVIAPFQGELDVLYGSSSGLFSTDPILIAGRPFNLRVGDYNGDRIDDVLFYTFAPDGDEQYEILYGSTDQLSPPVEVVELQGVSAAEPAILGFDAQLSQIGSVPQATTGIVASASDPDASVTLLFGNSSRTLASHGFALREGLTPLPAAQPIFGHFLTGMATEQMVFPIQGADPTGNGSDFAELDLLSVTLEVDGEVANELPEVIAATAAPVLAGDGFEIERCANVSTNADFDGDGADEVAIVQTASFDAGTFTCNALAPERLVVLHAENPVEQATNLASDLSSLSVMHAVDVDGDGHLDLVLVFAGTSLQCKQFPCVAAGNGLEIIWGSATGLTAETSELLPEATDGVIGDAAVVPIAPGDPGHLIVSFETGVNVFDVGSDHTLTPGTQIYAQGVRPTAATLATADVDGDGLVDVVLDLQGQIVTLFSVPQPLTSQ